MGNVDSCETGNSEDKSPDAVKEERHQIHADGSCLSNPGGPGGWAAVIESPDGERREISGGVPAGDGVTNNRMEMLAMIEALKALPDGCNITLYSDSRILIDANLKLARGKQPNITKNFDLWELLNAQKARHAGICWRWESGHAGNSLNERADFLARREAMAMGEGVLPEKGRIKDRPSGQIAARATPYALSGVRLESLAKSLRQLAGELESLALEATENAGAIDLEGQPLKGA